MKTIHLIVVGDESVDEHLAGVSILGASRALLFDVNNMRRKQAEELCGRLREMGVPSKRMGTEGEDYRDIYWMGRAVFEEYLTEKDICFAINLSAGSRMALAALEDASRTPVGEMHFVVPENPVLNAFRYELVGEDRKRVRIAPLTFPPVPWIQPGGKWVKRLGFRQRAFGFYMNTSLKWTYFKLRGKRMWVRFKRKRGWSGKRPKPQ